MGVYEETARTILIDARAASLGAETHLVKRLCSTRRTNIAPRRHFVWGFVFLDLTARSSPEESGGKSPVWPLLTEYGQVAFVEAYSRESLLSHSAN